MIEEFRGEYRFLSNFWPAIVFFEGTEYDCLEKAYVAAKFDKDLILEVKTDFGQQPVHVRGHIAKIDTAGKVKRFGRKHEKHLRSDWGLVKLDIMRQLVSEKFSEINLELAKKLMATGDQHIQEGNTWGDTYWGIVTGGRQKNLIGLGSNHLGKLLMARRTELQSFTWIAV